MSAQTFRMRIDRRTILAAVRDECSEAIRQSDQLRNARDRFIARTTAWAIWRGVIEQVIRDTYNED